MHKPSTRLVVTLLATMVSASAALAVEGRAWGDIHVQTMDGASYDFQQAGEFVASRSPIGDFEVQLRLESAGFSSRVSVATAVAARVDSSRISVALGRQPMLLLDDRPIEIPKDGLDLPSGGRIEKRGRNYDILWLDGSMLTIDVRKRHLNAFLRPAHDRRGTLTGLFGNFNGRSGDDVSPAIAEMGADSLAKLAPGLETVVTQLLEHGDSPWQLTQNRSLFEYQPGETTRSFHRSPGREASLSAIPSTWRRRAEAACREAGVETPAILKACIVDVGYTRDPSFAATAAAVEDRDVANWDAELGAGR